MINWYSVSFNALWILGLGLVTAGLSLASYLGGRQWWSFRQALKMPACRIMFDLGLVFFCLGWVGDASAMWSRLLWLILALIFIVRTWQARKISNP